MKHQRQEQIKKQNDLIAIASIKGCIEKDNIKEAVDIAERRKFTPEQFGKIANMTDLTAEEIYTKVIV